MARTAVSPREAGKTPGTIGASQKTADPASEIGNFLAKTASKYAVFILETNGDSRCIASTNVSIRASVSKIVYEELQISPQCSESEMSSVIVNPVAAVFDPMSMDHSPSHAMKRRLSRTTPFGATTSQRRSMMSKRSRAKALPLAIRELDSEGTDPFEVKHRVERDYILPPVEKSYAVDVTDEEQVVAFAFRCLSKIQHLANKAIAKFFIKRICPKKQAIYPYTKNGVEQPPAPWWPAVDQCKYTEPDHISKDERERLLIHLLRLRPTPEQLDEWNREGEEDFRRDRAVHVCEGWTRFLKGSFAAEDIATKNDCPRKLQQRRQWLEDLFAVAEMEENWKRYGQANRYVVLGDDDDDDSDIKARVPRRRKRAKKSTDSEVEAGEDTKQGLIQTLSDKRSPTPALDSATTFRTEHQDTPGSNRELCDSDLGPNNVETEVHGIPQANHSSRRPSAAMLSQYHRQASCSWGMTPGIPTDCQQGSAAWTDPNTPAGSSFTSQSTAMQDSGLNFDAENYRAENWTSQAEHHDTMTHFRPEMYQSAHAQHPSFVSEPRFDSTAYAEYFPSSGSEYNAVPSAGFLPSPKTMYERCTPTSDQLVVSGDSTGWNCQNMAFLSGTAQWGTMQDLSHRMHTTVYS